MLYSILITCSRHASVIYNTFARCGLSSFILPSDTPVLSLHSFAAGRNQSNSIFGGHFDNLNKKNGKYKYLFYVMKNGKAIDTFSSRRTSTATVAASK